MSTASENRDSDYITRVRAANKAIWDGINDLIEVRGQWNALGYGNTLTPGVGLNDGIGATEVGPVVFDTADALVAVLDANNGGHRANMAKLL